MGREWRMYKWTPGRTERIGIGSGRDDDEAGEEREVMAVDKVIYMLGG